MTVMILERVSPSVRGDLSRWMIEIKAGVFLGRINKLVREALWERCVQQADDGTVLQIWRANNEQGFDLRTYNPKGRIPTRYEGVWLVEVPDPDPRRES
jgi:CRISPR-associated protein Cas2